jgi:lipoate-protein ligase A
MAAWRLLVDESPGEGAWNMAVDRAIQVAVNAGDAGPTLRLYEWSCPTVTLGRFQDPDSVDREFCSARGIDVVRRPTGGRGVLHDDEVTYAVIAGVEHGVPRSTSASYRILCSGLSRAYRQLGIRADLTARPRGLRGSAACYLHATQADLSYEARKLSGSAQVWLGSTVLQHGSFAISRDIPREASVFRLSAEDRARLATETVTLESVLGTAPSRSAVRQAVIDGFSQDLGVEFVAGELSPAERETASRLRDELLAHPPQDPSVTGSR